MQAQNKVHERVDQLLDCNIETCNGRTRTLRRRFVYVDLVFLILPLEVREKLWEPSSQQRLCGVIFSDGSQLCSHGLHRSKSDVSLSLANYACLGAVVNLTLQEARCLPSQGRAVSPAHVQIHSEASTQMPCCKDQYMDRRTFWLVGVVQTPRLSGFNLVADLLHADKLGSCQAGPDLLMRDSGGRNRGNAHARPACCRWQRWYWRRACAGLSQSASCFSCASLICPLVLRSVVAKHIDYGVCGSFWPQQAS